MFGGVIGGSATPERLSVGSAALEQIEGNSYARALFLSRLQARLQRERDFREPRERFLHKL
eukprot:4933845-Pyramimonas_sp.AAC.1